ELALELNLPQQRINHHLKELLRVKLIRIAKRRKVRNLIEATYEAVGRVHWLSPKILRGEVEERQERDQLSLHNLLVMAESVQHDVGELLNTSEATAAAIASLGLSAELCLASVAERNEFSRELLAALGPVVRKYERPGQPGQRYTINVLCYPKAEGAIP